MKLLASFFFFILLLNVVMSTEDQPESAPSTQPVFDTIPTHQPSTTLGSSSSLESARCILLQNFFQLSSSLASHAKEFVKKVFANEGPCCIPHARDVQWNHGTLCRLDQGKYEAQTVARMQQRESTSANCQTIYLCWIRFINSVEYSWWRDGHCHGTSPMSHPLSTCSPWSAGLES
jgi:hypothetical protein